MKKVSFDFDDTLSFKSTQDYAKKLIDEGIEIHIITSRYENLEDYLPVVWPNGHNDLFEVAKELGIPKERIYFTNMQDKSDFLNKKSPDNFRDFIWHLDDDKCQINLINWKTKVKGIWSLSKNYEHDCNNLLGLTHLNK